MSEKITHRWISWEQAAKEFESTESRLDTAETLLKELIAAASDPALIARNIQYERLRLTIKAAEQYLKAREGK